MAKDSVSTKSDEWNDVLLDYRVAKEAADAVAAFPSCWMRDLILQMFEGAVRAVHHTPAPTLGGIVEKLHVYWRAGDLTDGSYGNNFRMQIIGDLRRIERQRKDVAEPEALEETDIFDLKRSWAEAANDFKGYSAQLADARSAEPGTKGATDLVALIDEAEVKLLSLPSPHVAAVIQKLEILWADGDWYGSIADTSLHAGIMGELLKFAEEEGASPCK